jgi:hypothetical protein
MVDGSPLSRIVQSSAAGHDARGEVNDLYNVRCNTDSSDRLQGEKDRDLFPIEGLAIHIMPR